MNQKCKNCKYCFNDPKLNRFLKDMKSKLKVFFCDQNNGKETRLDETCGTWEGVK